MSEFEAGIETRSVTSGWIATLNHGDGSAVGFWGPTEQAARQKAMEYGDDDREE